MCPKPAGLTSGVFTRRHRTVSLLLGYKMKSPRQRPPLIGLLLRATLWTPVGILIAFAWIASICAAVAMPLIGVLRIWMGDYLLGSASLAVGLAAFFVARYITKKVWEDPPSLL